ncbi:CD48 antigen [Labrus mixtus]|uniref:CD48 antigen n=1 Tax=Labrus mixtus TaxID=508554 RepID=UPI0029C0C43D|nr:CD48 antigen [Labrus mixtus]XP_060887098.1 CD48 antigen [Labrus mixtus]
MKLEILRLLFLQVVSTVRLVETVREATGYLEGSVTLASGANPKWNLSTIEWSIFTNFTWIATYRKGEENLDRVDRYKGRLTLNTTTGDLTIHKLTKEDNMEYTVDLVNTLGEDSSSKIKLKVNQQLQTPTIQTVLSSTSTEGGCWMLLHCSSTDRDVNLSWHVEGPNSRENWTGGNHTILVSLNTTQSLVTVTCTSRRNMGSSSTVITPKCDDSIPTMSAAPRYYYVVVFFAGVILGVSASILYVKRCNR